MSQGNTMPAQAAADSSKAMCGLHSGMEATRCFGYYWPLCSGMGRKREGTAGNLAQLQIHRFPPPYRKAETTQCFGAPAPLPRGQGWSCTAVTNCFLFPSSFNSCLVLAEDQERNKPLPKREVQLKAWELLMFSMLSFCSENTSTCTADVWKLASKSIPDWELGALSLLSYHK